jgi:hypothetical protein
MTHEEFIKTLNEKGYSYEQPHSKIVVTVKGEVYLDSLTHLPPGVAFNNEGLVWLHSLTHLPPGVAFNNKGGVSLASLTHLPPGVAFNNEGLVWLPSLTHLPPGVEFNNKGGVYLGSLGIDTREWAGNIKGINGVRLLNLMIKRGMFK